MARKLGYPHPDLMLEQLTSEQLTEILAYDTIDPVGDWREDFRMAFVLSHITNLFIQVYGKNDAKLTEPKDFMPNWNGEQELKNERKKEQSVEDMKRILLSLANNARNQKRNNDKKDAEK